MSFLSFLSTDSDSIQSRRDAVLRTLGVALRASFVAWMALVCLRIAGVWRPAMLLPIAILGILAVTALAWRHLSVRILPDGVTSLTGRALLGIGAALAACSVVGLLVYELTLHGSLTTLSPYAPLLAAQWGALSVYGWCTRIARERRLGPIDGDDGAFVSSVIGEVIGTAIDAGSSGD
jgi:hypothetical protein